MAMKPSIMGLLTEEQEQARDRHQESLRAMLSIHLIEKRHSSCNITKDVSQTSRPGSTTTRSEAGVVCMCDTGAGDYHDGFPTGRHYRRRRGIGRSARCDQVELPRLARPNLKGCCDICDIGSFGEQSGRTTGRLGSTGLRAMPSAGRHSRHSGASTAASAARPRHYQ